MLCFVAQLVHATAVKENDHKGIVCVFSPLSARKKRKEKKVARHVEKQCAFISVLLNIVLLVYKL